MWKISSFFWLENWLFLWVSPSWFLWTRNAFWYLIHTWSDKAIQGTVVPLYRCTVVPLYRCTVVPKYRCTVVPLYRCTEVPLYRCTVVPLYRCTVVNHALQCLHGGSLEITHTVPLKKLSLFLYQTERYCCFITSLIFLIRK